MSHRGAAMLVVLAVMGLAAMLAAGLLFMMRAEMEAATARSRGEQAYVAAMSGLQQAILVIRQHADDPDAWQDNPEWFRNQLVLDDGVEQWYFSVWAPPIPASGSGGTSDDEVRYGLEDESARLHLNVAPAETIRRLPDMTDELADALIDFRDADDDASPLGCEQEYYNQLPQPYTIRNNKFTTVEELLLVRGFNGGIVFGEDVNRSGILDANEDDSEATFPPDDGDGQLSPGLASLLTIYTRQLDQNSAGEQRIPITAEIDVLRRHGVPEQTLQYIELVRAEGGKIAHPADLLEAEYELKLNHDAQPAGSIVQSGVGADVLAVIIDTLGPEHSEPMLEGLVNVMTASASVLAALPGLDEDTAARIVDMRSGLDEDTRATVAWLYTEGVLDVQQFREAAPHLTVRSSQFRVRSIGFGAKSGRYRMIEAVVDRQKGAEPSIVYLRDTTRLGLPVALDVESVEVSQ